MVKELNFRLRRTNSDSSRVEELNQGPPDFKYSLLNHTTGVVLQCKNIASLFQALDSWGQAKKRTTESLELARMLLKWLNSTICPSQCKNLYYFYDSFCKAHQHCIKILQRETSPIMFYNFYKFKIAFIL